MERIHSIIRGSLEASAWLLLVGVLAVSGVGKQGAPTQG